MLIPITCTPLFSWGQLGRMEVQFSNIGETSMGYDHTWWTSGVWSSLVGRLQDTDHASSLRSDVTGDRQAKKPAILS